MNRPRISPLLRLQFLGVLMLLGLGALAVRLWWVQVARGPDGPLGFAAAPKPPCASHRFAVRFATAMALRWCRTGRVTKSISICPRWSKAIANVSDRRHLLYIAGRCNGMPKDLKEADIVKIVNDGIVPRLDDLDLARDYNAGQLQRHFRTNTEVPYSYIKDIDFPTMAKFSEHDVGLPGVDITIKPVRSYVYGALAAHLLGYVGAAGRHQQGGSEEIHLLSDRCGREIQRRENDGRISERQTGGPLHAA